MIRFHGDTSVWPIIKEQIKKTRKSQQIFAAIAYVGLDATKIMPLRRGDVLVCNASDAAIKQGSTSAIALEKLLRRGVKIFNEPNLHGKVVVFPMKAFVGSANVSRRSEDVLLEAVVETAAPRVIASARNFVKRHAREMAQLDRENIQKMRNIKVKRPVPDGKPRADLLSSMELPSQVPVLKLLPVGFAEYSTAAENEIAASKRDVRAHFFAGGSSASIEGEVWHSDWWRDFQPGMWYVGVTKSGRIYKPRKVLRLSKVSKRLGVVWLAVPEEGRNFIKDPALLSRLGFIWESDTVPVLRDAETRAFLKRFNDK
jgi:hypothetical protein